MNFSEMYSHVEQVMVDSKVAKRLETPHWVDKTENRVDDETKAFGCKIEVELERPGMVLFLHKVGCNTSQECDNALGGKLF